MVKFSQMVNGEKWIGRKESKMIEYQDGVVIKLEEKGRRKKEDRVDVKEKLLRGESKQRTNFKILKPINFLSRISLFFLEFCSF